MRSHLSLMILPLLLVCLSAQAQRGLSTSNKKALKAYNDGLTCMRYNDAVCAEEKMIKAYELDPDFLEPRLVLAEIYSDKGQDDQAIVQYEEVLHRSRTFFPNAIYHLGKLKFRTGKLEEADKLFSEFLEVTPGHNKLRGLAQLGIDNCVFTRLASKTPVPFFQERRIDVLS